MAKTSVKVVKKLIPTALKSDEVLMTRDGLVALEEEYEILKNSKRKQVAARLKEAISFGDLSENSEYEEAKNEQAFLEGRIMELELMLKNAKVVSESGLSKQIVEIGSKVTVRNGKNDYTFTLVGVTEVDPMGGKLSNESPLGMSLIGQKAGDIVSFESPSGIKSYTVIKLH